MSIIIKGGSSTGETNVTILSALTVNTPMVVNNTGFVVGAGEVDAGTITGNRIVRPFYIGQDYRTIINVEKPIWDDNFSSTVVNNAKYKVSTSTQTVEGIDGFLSLNEAGSVADGTSCQVSTFKYFSIGANAPTYVNIKAKFSALLQQNSIIEFGLGIATGTLAPTDGVFFRASAGTLNAVAIKGGYETINVDVHTPEVDVVYDYLLAITDDNIEFWVDDIIVSNMTPTPITGGTSLSNSMPLFLRSYNSGGTVPSAIKLGVSRIDVLVSDYKTNRNWPTTMALNGQSSISKTDGQPSSNSTSGTTSANLANSVSPLIANATNTTSGYANIGGEFLVNASAGTETDYIVFAYLNPADAVYIPRKSFNISSININTYAVGAAMSTSATVFDWVLGIGGTAESLLEEDSLTNGTRAARRIAIGSQNLLSTAVEGACATPRINYNFRSPLVVEAGSYFHVILRIPVGNPTSNLFFRGMVNVNGYFD